MLKIRTAAAAVLSASVAIIVFAPAVQARPYKVLHSFAGATGDGDRPMADVAFDSVGNLYGTTYSGGSSDNGTIFKIAPDRTYTVLHSFNGSTGANPMAGLTIDLATGDLYGLTQAGGSAGEGVLYKLTAGGTYTVLHNFAGGANDGRYPGARMIRDKKGNFYGTTMAGGPLDEGVVFEYSKRGVFTVLHAFDTTSGPPVGRLDRDSQGNLYGALSAGGDSQACSGHGCGAIFELAPDGTFVIRYSFTNGDDGRYPFGGVTLDKNGNLYGTNSFGGVGGFGVLFRLTPVGDFSTLYSFDGTHGTNSSGEVLIVKNNLFVTTLGGGANDHGTIVKVSTSGGGTVLHDFTGNDGSLVAAGLVRDGLLLYGTASAGGASDHGVVFSLKK